jgi:hypothetical protein
MNLQCRTWPQVLKVHAAFNLGLNNIAIYLVTQVAMGAKKARTRHGSGGLHKTLFEISHIRVELTHAGSHYVQGLLTHDLLQSAIKLWQWRHVPQFLSGLATGLPHYTGAGSLPCALQMNASQM